MQKYDVVMALESVKDSREKWKVQYRDFDTNLNKVLDRLIHEAVACFMSIEDVMHCSGLRRKQVTDLMRRNNLRPSDGKTLLAKHAAEALATNSELLGIAPHEMDLMSPLAYLPMGKEMRQALTDKTVSRVTELPEDEVLHTCPECRSTFTESDGVLSGYNPPEYEYGDAKQLADKLEDAGPMPDEAKAWVNEVISRGVLIP